MPPKTTQFPENLTWVGVSLQVLGGCGGKGAVLGGGGGPAHHQVCQAVRPTAAHAVAASVGRYIGKFTISNIVNIVNTNILNRISNIVGDIVLPLGGGILFGDISFLQTHKRNICSRVTYGQN